MNAITDLRKLTWLYLILLVFEGALRKWIVPQLDAPLLICRDPLVVWIYIQAMRQGYSLKSPFLLPTLVLAFLTAAASTAFGIANGAVTAYGLRTDFLQIPFVFLLPKILNRDDVIAMGKFFFLVAIPMAALMVLQFRSPYDSLWNKGTMITHYGTVRPSGTFSFVSGAGAFFTVATAFLLFGYLQGGIFKLWQMLPVLFAILASAAVSGSRTGVVSIALVVAAAIFTVLVRGKGIVGVAVAAVLILLSVPILSAIPVFENGAQQMMQRFEDAGAQEVDQGGFAGRYLSSISGPFVLGDRVPMFGFGLGLGTNAGQSLYHGNADLWWPEQEWDRLTYESGTMLGFLMCLFRAALVLNIGVLAFAACRRDNILPLLLFSSCALLIFNGQWGVPTLLGFSIFTGGLTLAACNLPESFDDGEHEDEHEPADEHRDDEEHPEESHAADVIGEAP